MNTTNTNTTEINEAVKSILDIDNSTVDLDTYKNRPMFVINKNSRYPFSLGLAKAKLLVKHADALKRFVETEGKTV